VAETTSIEPEGGSREAPGSGAEARRIAVVVHSLNPGGAQRRLVTLANAFAAAGRDVDFVALRGGGDVDRLLDPAVRLNVLNRRPKPVWKPWMFEGWRALTRWLAANRVDAVLAGITTVHLTALVASRRQGRKRPLVALRASRHPFRHFPWSRPFKHLFEPIERGARWRIYDEADLVIAVSGETAEGLRSRLSHPEHCIALPNPVVTPAFAASLAKSVNYPWFGGESPVILAVGRLAWQKRFDILIDALAIVRRTRDARLIILGEGHYRGALEAQVQRLGLSDAVAMPGNVAEVGAWMAKADLLVSTSAFEGSPAVLIEALAAGLPVVATRCPGGSVELLECVDGAALVAMDDPDAAAAAILALLEKPRDPAALRTIAARYTVAASADAYLSAFDAAIVARGTNSGLAR
jgi:glycosyltransferase involved in cell wall biosynthesis